MDETLVLIYSIVEKNEVQHYEHVFKILKNNYDGNHTELINIVLSQLIKEAEPILLDSIIEYIDEKEIVLINQELKKTILLRRIDNLLEGKYIGAYPEAHAVRDLIVEYLSEDLYGQ